MTTPPAYDPEFRGVWASVAEYIREQAAEQMPPHMTWVLDYCDPAQLELGDCDSKLWIEARPLPDGRVQIFERLTTSA